jgi:RNA-binding protein
MTLTNRQLSFLRGLGQRLRPALHLGREGHTPGTQQALAELLAHRELVKVRVLPSAALPAQAVAAAMAAAAGAVLVGVVGHTFVLYRPNPELKERIELPAAGAPEPPVRRARR